ncbi:hypothetical protein [Streptococcus orisasini]|uniref:hypothetical protein n=1 Tax=Streptococcus orisasini TaxID=1080071 RepID=UPI0007102955|nr:hypothetical protein [Streptococcus orisasini]
MRKNINIVWLEDDLKAGAHKKRVNVVENILKEKGYISNFIFKKTFDEAKQALEEDNRIDFFISDFNLEQDETGLTYLDEIRKSRGYKQFVILYSNKSNSDLKKDVIDYFKLPATPNFTFSNFTFFSVSGNRLIEQNFKDAIEVILCRWDELNALRGQYMYENAELEYHLRKLCTEYPTDKPYKELVKSYFFKKLNLSNIQRSNPSCYDKLKKIKDNWLILVDRRNALAHVIEDYDSNSGYYIKSISEKQGDSFTISESNLDEERCNLLEVVDMVKKLLKIKS